MSENYDDGFHPSPPDLESWRKTAKQLKEIAELAGLSFDEVVDRYANYMKDTLVHTALELDRRHNVWHDK